jgi:hypothetical protein
MTCQAAASRGQGRLETTIQLYMTRPSYQHYVEEFTNGSTYGIFVDDTGSPGLKDTPPNVHPERKTWVAVIVPPNLMREVWSQFPNALGELRNLIGAQEFHFCDIYAGRGEFKNVDLQLRLSLFEFMAYIFSVYRFPVIVQTLDPDSHAAVQTVSNCLELPEH